MVGTIAIQMGGCGRCGKHEERPQGEQRKLLKQYKGEGINYNEYLCSECRREVEAGKD